MTFYLSSWTTKEEREGTSEALIVSEIDCIILKQTKGSQTGTQEHRGYTGGLPGVRTG